MLRLHMLGREAIPIGLAPSRRMAQCGRVGVPPLLRFMGPRGDVTLPRGHRGVRRPLPGGRQRGDSYGLAPSRRMAQCGRVGMPQAVTMGISPSRHREHVRTGGYSDGTGARGHVRTEKLSAPKRRGPNMECPEGVFSSFICATRGSYMPPPGNEKEGS